MNFTVADLSKDLGTNADLLRPYFPRVGFGLEEAGSVKLEAEVKGDSTHLGSKIRDHPNETSMKQCA